MCERTLVHHLQDRRESFLRVVQGSVPVVKDSNPTPVFLFDGKRDSRASDRGNYWQNPVAMETPPEGARAPLLRVVVYEDQRVDAVEKRRGTARRDWI